MEAKVGEEKWDTLENAYRAAVKNKSGPMPLQSFLVQMKEELALWQIISIWENMEVLQKMRDSNKTPAGVLIFRQADAEPKLSLFEMKEEMHV